MKSIRLKETTIESSQPGAADFTLKYREEYLRMVEVYPEGITVSQMRSALRVITALKKAGPTSLLVLEDADWEYLKTRAENFRFGLAAPEIVEMVDAVINAEPYEAPHLKGEESKKAKA